MVENEAPVYLDLEVSENSGFSPQIIHFNRVFHYKPSNLGYIPGPSSLGAKWLLKGCQLTIP